MGNRKLYASENKLIPSPDLITAITLETIVKTYVFLQFHISTNLTVVLIYY